MFFVVASVLGVIAGLAGGPDMARTLMLPAALLLAAMFSTSIYFSFQACFEDETQAPQSASVARAE